MPPQGPSPTEFDFGTLSAWLSDLGRRETHRAERYDLTLTLEPEAGTLEVEGVVRLVPAAAEASRRPSGVARFLLNPDLELLPPEEGTAQTAQSRRPAPRTVPLSARREHPALREVALAPGQPELHLRYHGRLPAAWVSPGAAELALYNLWYPVFSSRLLPFTFRLLVRVPRGAVPAVSGRLVPLPPELVPGIHDDTRPRTYLWESLCPSFDIALTAGPYMVHQGRLEDAGNPYPAAGPKASGGPGDGGNLWGEVFVLADDYDLGELLLGWMAKVYRALAGWFGPLPSSRSPDTPRARAAPTLPPRVAVVVPPVSHWGGYARPGYIVIPRPTAAALRAGDQVRTVALMLAYEMGHLWYGAAVLSDTVSEPWMSEAFAELARLLFEEAEWGRVAYRERLERYEREVSAVSDPKPMTEVGAAHPEMDVLVRRRGALMLAELRDLLGDRAMGELLVGFAAGRTGEVVHGMDFVTEATRVAEAHGVAPRDVRGLFSSYLDRPPRTSKKG